MDERCVDTELIECADCGAVLNGKNLWIVGEGEDVKTICEKCHQLTPERGE